MPDIDIKDYPSGNVTFVFTDIEESSRMTTRLEEHGLDVYQRKLQQPQRVRLKAEADLRHGFEIQRQGDGHMFVFQRAADALACVVAFQQSLWGDPIVHPDGDEDLTIRVRVGVHTAEKQRKPVLMENGLVEYPGRDTNFAARVAGLGRGGQILVSETSAKESRHLDDCRLQTWPNRLLKSFEDKARVLTEILYHPDQEPLEPGMQWLPEWYQAEVKLYVPRTELEALVVEQFRSKAGGAANPSRWRSIGQDGPRIVTLKAEGGMGKTRLAVQCAAQVADLFPDGVYFVPLATTLPNVEAVAAAIGQGIGMAAKDSLPAKVLTALKSRTVLLVLDNYESVEDATGDPDRAVARYLIRLIAEVHGLRLLVTGRSAVNVSDLERIIEGQLEQGMLPGEARELFLHLARLRWGGDHNLTVIEEPHLARILDLTARIPLAIELAAAWVGYYELREIADGLEATPLGEETSLPPRHLRFDHDTAQGRHDSLTRSLDWSYGLLDRTGTPTAQIIFAACGLFADSFDHPTVAAVTGVAKARQTLNLLLDASLVRREGAGGESRYRLHRFTREYARRRLGEGPDIANETQRRFVEHYTLLIEENASDPNQLFRYATLDKERQNALAAWSLAESLQDEKSLYRMYSLGYYLQYRGFWSESEYLYKQTLTLAQAANSKETVSSCLSNMGIVFRLQGRYAEALDVYAQALAIRRESKDRVGEGKTLNNLGNVYESQGRYDEALDVFAQALAICRESKDRVGEGKTLNNLGNVYESQGRYDEALEVYAQDLAICREQKDRVGEGLTLINLGTILQLTDRYDEALDVLTQALAIHREHKDRLGEGKTLVNLGANYLRQDRYDEALHVFAQALPICRESKDRVGEGQIFNNLGIVYESQGRYDEALDIFAQALFIRRESKDRVGEGQILNNMAVLAKARDDLPEAIRLAKQALKIFMTTEAPVELVRARQLLALLEGETLE